MDRLVPNDMMRRSGSKLLSETPGTGEPIKKDDRVKVCLNGWLNQGHQIQETHLCEVIVGSRDGIFYVRTCDNNWHDIIMLTGDSAR